MAKQLRYKPVEQLNLPMGIVMIIRLGQKPILSLYVNVIAFAKVQNI